MPLPSPTASPNQHLVIWRSVLYILVITTVALFIGGVVVLGWQYVVMHDQRYQAPCDVAWGVVLTTMGALLREALSRLQYST